MKQNHKGKDSLKLIITRDANIIKTEQYKFWNTLTALILNEESVEDGSIRTTLNWLLNEMIEKKMIRSVRTEYLNRIALSLVLEKLDNIERGN